MGLGLKAFIFFILILHSFSYAQEVSYLTDINTINEIQLATNGKVVRSDHQLYSTAQEILKIVDKHYGPEVVATDVKNISFALVDSPSFIAYMEPERGNLVLSTGLLQSLKSDDELAFIISHELTHSNYDLSDSKKANSVKSFLESLASAKKEEFRADINGVKRVAAVGEYSPYGYRSFFNRLIEIQKEKNKTANLGPGQKSRAILAQALDEHPLEETRLVANDLALDGMIYSGEISGENIDKYRLADEKSLHKTTLVDEANKFLASDEYIKQQRLILENDIYESTQGRWKNKLKEEFDKVLSVEDLSEGKVKDLGLDKAFWGKLSARYGDNGAVFRIPSSVEERINLVANNLEEANQLRSRIIVERLKVFKEYYDLNKTRIKTNTQQRIMTRTADITRKSSISLGVEDPFSIKRDIKIKEKQLEIVEGKLKTFKSVEEQQKFKIKKQKLEEEILARKKNYQSALKLFCKKSGGAELCGGKELEVLVDRWFNEVSLDVAQGRGLENYLAEGFYVKGTEDFTFQSRALSAEIWTDNFEVANKAYTDGNGRYHLYLGKESSEKEVVQLFEKRIDLQLEKIKFDNLNGPRVTKHLADGDSLGILKERFQLDLLGKSTLPTAEEFALLLREKPDYAVSLYKNLFRKVFDEKHFRSFKAKYVPPMEELVYENIVVRTFEDLKEKLSRHFGEVEKIYGTEKFRKTKIASFVNKDLEKNLLSLTKNFSDESLLRIATSLRKVETTARGTRTRLGSGKEIEGIFDWYTYESDTFRPADIIQKNPFKTRLEKALKTKGISREFFKWYLSGSSEDFPIDELLKKSHSSLSSYMDEQFKALNDAFSSDFGNLYTRMEPNKLVDIYYTHKEKLVKKLSYTDDIFLNELVKKVPEASYLESNFSRARGSVDDADRIISIFNKLVERVRAGGGSLDDYKALLALREYSSYTIEQVNSLYLRELENQLKKGKISYSFGKVDFDGTPDWSRPIIGDVFESADFDGKLKMLRMAISQEWQRIPSSTIGGFLADSKNLDRIPRELLFSIWKDNIFGSSSSVYSKPLFYAPPKLGIKLNDSAIDGITDYILRMDYDKLPADIQKVLNNPNVVKASAAPHTKLELGKSLLAREFNLKDASVKYKKSLVDAGTIRDEVVKAHDLVVSMFGESGSQVKDELLNIVEESYNSSFKEATEVFKPSYLNFENVNKAFVLGSDLPLMAIRQVQTDADRIKLTKYLLGMSEGVEALSILEANMAVDLGDSGDSIKFSTVRRLFLESSPSEQTAFLTMLLKDFDMKGNKDELLKLLFSDKDKTSLKAAKHYLGVLSLDEQKTLISNLLTRKLVSGEKALSVADVLLAFDSIGIKAAQFLASTNLLPEAERAKLDFVFDKAEKPSRQKVFQDLEMAFGKDLLKKCRVGNVLGAGSINLTYTLVCKDKKYSVTFQKENVKGRISNHNEVLIRAEESMLKSGDPELEKWAKISRQAREYAMKSLDPEKGVELNQKAQRAQEALARKAYETDSVKVAKVEEALQLKVKLEFRNRVSVFEYIESVDIDKLPKREAKKVAMKIIEAENRAQFTYGLHDLDGHKGNWLIQKVGSEYVPVRIDYPLMTQLSEAEVKDLKKALAFLFKKDFSSMDLENLDLKALSNIFGLDETTLSKISKADFQKMFKDMPGIKKPFDRIFYMQTFLENKLGMTIQVDPGFREQLSSITKRMSFMKYTGEKKFFLKLFESSDIDIEQHIDNKFLKFLFRCKKRFGFNSNMSGRLAYV